MTSQYEEVKGPRFVVDSDDGIEQITIPAQHNIFIMFFLAVWLVFWTFGGVNVMKMVFSKPNAQPFLFFWLCGWAVGEGVVTLTLTWLFSGAEIIRVLEGNLEIAYRVAGFSRRKLYRGAEIRALSSQAVLPFGRSYRMQLPFLIGNKTGAVKFTYGARTIYAAADLDESEGRLIVDWLRKRLPSNAMA